MKTSMPNIHTTTFVNDVQAEEVNDFLFGSHGCSHTEKLHVVFVDENKMLYNGDFVGIGPRISALLVRVCVCVCVCAIEMRLHFK